jgi:hypothetical protein
MALSLGKPVIFYCDLETRQKFYRDIRPSRDQTPARPIGGPVLFCEMLARS